MKKKAIPFGASATADKVLAGIDLTGKRFIVTGCNSGLGYETMNSLAANGAQVIGLARTLDNAAEACRKAGPTCTPIACDLGDLDSIATAIAQIRQLDVPLDAIIANAGVARLPAREVRYEVERQFLVNHLGHFSLINDLVAMLRDGSGRVVIVSGATTDRHAPREGIMFDNLDGGRFYDSSTFYAQSKLATALFAKELSRRLAPRAIAVNSVHPGAARGTGINEHLPLIRRFAVALMRPFMKSAAQGAATQTLLAASPLVSGLTGEHWADCQISKANPLLDDAPLAARLWAASLEIVSRNTALLMEQLRHAA